MPMNARVQGFLEGSHVPYEVLAHPLAFTAQGVAHASHVSGWQMAKVVVVRPSSGQTMMAVLPASCRLDLKHFEEVSGAKGLSLVSEAEMHDVFPDCETGAMPPFGNLYGLPVFVDAHLAREKQVASRRAATARPCAWSGRTSSGWSTRRWWTSASTEGAAVETTIATRLELDEREAELLREVCHEALGELRAEIVRTENADFRHALQAREELLKSLLLRLRPAA
jgi:Ala-tRNA(Pro) deacylase